MVPGRLARVCLRIIDRYQGSRGATAFDKSCRFTPSCCTFMKEAFSRQSLPIAFMLSAGRLARCNPLVRAHTNDPVSHRRMPGLRPNAVRTAGVAVLVSGSVLLIASAALGQTVSGGCSATINGRSVTTMTRDDPLQVEPGQLVSVTGNVPASFTVFPRIESFTAIDIFIIDPIYKAKIESGSGTGPQWGDTVRVDRYLEWGSGLYKLNGRARITAGDQETGCRVTAYIEMKGSQRATAIAGGIAAVSGAAAAAAPGRKRKDMTVSQLGATLDADVKRDIPGIDTPPSRTVVAPEQVRIPCCAVVAVMAPLAAFGMVGAGGISGTPRSYAPGTVLATRRVWKRGHPIVGFVAGLLFGLGITVVLQQQGVWILNVATGIVLPAATGVLAGVRGWYGRAYRVSVVAEGDAFAAPVATPTWRPTHAVVSRSLQAWTAPDPASGPAGELAARTEVRVLERLDDWAHVDAENGWSGWVNAEGLKPL